ncbi:MAG TPA: iron-containing alcohol dehydrogenase [Polyangiaceae bacterium]|nr:iron-containing alcohol dehydrogenase [Polyangiaceae bacterium]
MTHTFSFPTTIHFGPGARKLVARHLKAAGVSRPLIVTDRGVAALPMHGELKQTLEAEGLAVGSFSGVVGNPLKSQVDEGVRAYKGHDADSIVGLGGGAAIDVAKAIALLATHPGDLFDYEDEKPGARPIDGPIPYWVALPTTAGTGSEVGRSSVVSDDATHVKKIIFSPKLLARAVFADPELTVGLPPAVTAATGMDALTHCVEAFLAKNYHPICDGIALEGLRLVAENLVRAYESPRDVEARGAMLMASMMGAIAFQKGLGLTHSCAHALGTVADMHHGLANGVMIDHALAFNAEVSAQRFARMAQAAGLKDASAKGFLAWLAELKAAVKVPARLRDAGVTREQLPKLVEIATADACHPNNPREVARADFERIFDGAY